MLCHVLDLEKAQSLFRNYLDQGQDKLYAKHVNEMFNDLLENPLQTLEAIQIEDEVNKLSPSKIKVILYKFESG